MLLIHTLFSIHINLRCISNHKWSIFSGHKNLQFSCTNKSWMCAASLSIHPTFYTFMYVCMFKLFTFYGTEEVHWLIHKQHMQLWYIGGCCKVVRKHTSCQMVWLVCNRSHLKRGKITPLLPMSGSISFNCWSFWVSLKLLVTK